MNFWQQDIKYLTGVGPSRASLLEKELGIKTLGDLLTYFPYKYVDRTHIIKIHDIDGNMPYVQIKGEILSIESVGEGRSKRLIAHFSDGTGVVDLVWFQGLKYALNNIDLHKQYIIFGTPKVFGGRINIAHPEISEPKPNFNVDEPSGTNGLLSLSLVPSYNTTEKMKNSGLNSSAVGKLTANLLSMLNYPLSETLPDYIIDKYHLISYDEAIRNIHYPKNAIILRKAQERLKFEELFYVQVNILRYARDRILKYRGIMFSRVGDAFYDFYHNHLPFELTGAQKRVVREIRQDMGSGKQMNRLLQGDVGSGKTLVALLCALIAKDNNCQTCVMAPTEILAEQHLHTLREFVSDMPIKIELLTGSVKGKKRNQVLSGLITGEIDILVGTHAVIEDNVIFNRLGLVIIDEQHRFGVAQRAKLWQKNPTPPHVLVMTATPIPRTLAMTLYGDLDVSVIDELPPGRKPIETVHMYDANRSPINNLIRREIEKGQQIYIVYPLIQESEKMDLKNLEDGFLQIQSDFPQYHVSKVHGKMKPAEKDVEMLKFASGETQILVSTTVIEVGVNVPNASVMIIENAERFGLSQLHQLRGRVGRGAKQSFCVLITGFNIASETAKRIQIMVDSNDGFEIAEQDLKLRGPGDLEGTQQSGMAFDLKIANLARDGQILQLAREAATLVINNDPDEHSPENEIVWRRMKEIRKNNINWGSIS